MTREELGKIIHDERIKQKLSCRQLGFLSGTSAGTVSRTENPSLKDKTYVSFKSLRKICKALGIEEYDKYESEIPKEELFIIDGNGLIPKINTAIKLSNGEHIYDVGFRNGLRFAKYLIDGRKPEYEEVEN